MDARLLAIGLLAAALPGTAAAEPADTLRPLCPDRPGKATSPCTVDEGHLQLELEAVNATLQRHDGVTVDSYIYANPTIKYGVTDNFDVEINLTPYVEIRTHDRETGITQTESGLGDLFLRAKYVPVSGSLAIGIEPFLKIPTADKEIGNGAVEGGLLLPVGLDLGGNWTLSSTPEIDIIENQERAGHHAAIVNVIGLNRAIPAGVTLSAELWSSTDIDPDGTIQQYSVDFATAWQPESDPDLQLDAGVNVGLNGETPDLQLYAGVSRRF